MKKFLRLFLKILQSYSLEERVVSVVAVLLLVIVLAKNISFIIHPSFVFADQSVDTEAIINDRPTLINPLYVDFAQANRDISQLVFSGLVKYDSSLDSFVDDMAVLSIDKTKKIYTFSLKDNVLWHDDTPVTADDILFTFNDVINNPAFQNPVLKANFEGVKVEKVDDRTVKFILDRPNSFFVTNMNVGILPKHLLGGIDVSTLASNDYNLNPVGTGPYAVASSLELLDDGRQKIRLKINEKYYGNKPKIKEIRFNIYPDDEAMRKDISTINIVSKVSESLSKILESDRFELKNYSLPQYTAVFFNTEDALLKNSKLRLALTKSVDKTKLLGDLLNKIPVDTPLMELNQSEWLFKPNVTEAAGLLYDLNYRFEKDDQGKIKEGQVYRKDKNQKELSLTLVARQYDEGLPLQIETQKTVEFLVDAWRQVGIKVDVVYFGEQDFLAVLQEKKYQMILGGQNMGYNLDTFPYWHSSQAKEGSMNFSLYKSFAADTQIEKIRSTFDQNEKIDRMKKLAEVISGDVPALFLYRPQYIFATDKKVQGIVLENLSYPADRFSQIEKWCVGEKC
jgi:peptide/nickel transport system substrate-binding protein